MTDEQRDTSWDADPATPEQMRLVERVCNGLGLEGYFDTTCGWWRNEWNRPVFVPVVQSIALAYELGRLDICQPDFRNTAQPESRPSVSEPGPLRDFAQSVVDLPAVPEQPWHLLTLQCMAREALAAAPEAPAQRRALIEEMCAAIKAADDKSMAESNYMLDSKDCIKVLRSLAAAPEAPALHAMPSRK